MSAWLLLALLAALKARRDAPGAGVDLVSAAWQIAHPATINDWVQVGGILAFAAIAGLFTAAVVAARHGAAGTVAGDDAELS